jgi:heme oxygenase (biliverdin-IX-beta and delta-forming)
MTDELATKARALFRRVGAGVLSTHSNEMTGFPFGSLAPFALTLEGRPLLYVSKLAEHTRNLAANPRCCLTVVEATLGDPQAVGRASLLGEAHALPDAERSAAADRYFALFPESRAYEQMGDFGFWRIEPVRVRWIGGFGEIRWIERDEWLVPTPEWSSGESYIVGHMNEDHIDAMEAMVYARFGEAPEDVVMLACDAEGFHLRSNGVVRWIPFAKPCATQTDVRMEMVRLTREARAAGGG